MQRLLLFVTLLMASVLATAEVKTFVRDYTYRASETDSKVSARQAALQQLQSLVIQESGVTVKSSFENTETLKDGSFQQSQKANYLTLAQAHTQTKILEEKWDGETFYIKAFIEIDTDAIANVSDQGKTLSCSEMQKKVKTLILDVKDPKVQGELVKLSMANPLEGHCYKWQYIIIDKFRELAVPNDEYRQFLFDGVAKVADHEKGNLLMATIKYGASYRKITKEEFEVVRSASEYMNHADIKWLTGVLMEITTQVLPYGAPPEEVARNANRQWVSMLDWQLSVLYRQAYLNKLGKPKSMTVSEIMGEVMEKMMVKNKGAFLSYYLYNHQHLDDRANIAMARKMASYIKRDVNSNSMEILDLFIKDVPVNKKVNTHIIKLLIHINGKEGSTYYKQAVEKIVNANREKITAMASNSTVPKSKRKKWMTEYNLSMNTH